MTRVRKTWVPRNQVPEEGSESEEDWQQIPGEILNISDNTYLL